MLRARSWVLVLVFSALVTAGCGAPLGTPDVENPLGSDMASVRGGAEAAGITWLARRVVEVAPVEAPATSAERAALKSLVGSARVVSLGEATHGSRELFLWKNRIIRQLVEAHDFERVLFEVNQTDARALNDWVLGGPGDARALLATLTVSGPGGIYDTEEVLALLEWMRHHNQTHAKKVEFAGFDMQNPVSSGAALGQYLMQVAPQLLAMLEAPEAPTSDPLAELTAAHNRMQDFRAELSKQREALIAAWPTGKEAGRLAFENAEADSRQLLQYLELTLAMGKARTPEEGIAAGDLRDRFMAENARALLSASAATSSPDGPPALRKGILWLHNGHAFTADRGHSHWPLGRLLKESLGEDLRTLVTAVGQGEVRARPTNDPGTPAQPVPLAPPPPGTLDAVLEKTAHKAASPGAIWISIRGKRPVAVNAWLESSMALRGIGASYDQSLDPSIFLDTVRPASSFDAIVYFPVVTAARAIPR